MAEPIQIGEVIRRILTDLRDDAEDCSDRIDYISEGLENIQKTLQRIEIDSKKTNSLLEEVLERQKDSCEVLTPGLAAQYTGKTLQTLRNYVLRGQLKKVTIDGITGYRKSDLKRIFHL